MVQKAFFLDRDGVVNKDKGYVFKYNEFEWIDGSKELITLLKKKGHLVFIITNQSGIARGYYSEIDVDLLHKQINNELNKLNVKIDDFFYSPYHPSDISGRFDHLKNLRKPNTGMLEAAFNKWNLVKENCLLIGNNETDMMCAKNFGIKGYLFKDRNLLKFCKKNNII